MKLAFVILQYMASDDTMECVASIRRYAGTEDYKIIIVDNCSPDDSCEKVQAQYGQDEDVVLIRSKSNLGFAKGNNLGYRYVLKHYQPEYVIMLNNDVLLIEDGIYEVLSDCYRRHDFAVMGPMIFTADGLYTSSPMIADHKGRPDDAPATKKEFQKSIRKYECELFLIRLHIYDLIRYVYKKFIEKPESHGGPDYFKEHINCRLHGSFLVFSQKYQNHFPSGLDSRTFMYDEEYFLQYHVMNAGMKLLYSPAYRIYHKEDASTSAMLKTKTKKAQFQLQGMVRSRKLYIEMLENGED